jgi:hypothetical protein
MLDLSWFFNLFKFNRCKECGERKSGIIRTPGVVSFHYCACDREELAHRRPPSPPPAPTNINFSSFHGNAYTTSWGFFIPGEVSEDQEYE